MNKNLCLNCQQIPGFNELKKTLPATDFVKNGLYVFNVGGNKFRVIARIIFSAYDVYTVL